jgi:hypothetical protein
MLLFVLLAANVAAVMYLLIVWAPFKGDFDVGQEEFLIAR